MDYAPRNGVYGTKDKPVRSTSTSRTQLNSDAASFDPQHLRDECNYQFEEWIDTNYAKVHDAKKWDEAIGRTVGEGNEVAGRVSRAGHRA